MNAEFDAEWRQTGFFTETDRWSVGASFSKRLYRNKAKTFNIRADVGYKFLSSSRQAYTVDKRNPEDYGEDFVLEDDMEPQVSSFRVALSSSVSRSALLNTSVTGTR